MKNLFNIKVNIERATTISDGLGGIEVQWSVIHSAIPARIQSSRANRMNSYLDKEELIADYFAYIAYLSDILVGDRVVFDSRIFEIRRIENPDQTSRYLKLYLREVF
jgi:head-tail adaptor